MRAMRCDYEDCEEHVKVHASRDRSDKEVTSGGGVCEVVLSGSYSGHAGVILGSILKSCLRGFRKTQSTGSYDSTPRNAQEHAWNIPM